MPGNRASWAWLRPRHFVLASIVGAFMAPVTGRAQPSAPTGVVAGVVRDSTGAGVAGVELVIERTGLRVASDELGGFRFVGVPAGTATIRARRLGFQPQSVDVSVAAGLPASADVRLVPVIQRLAPVQVSATRSRYTGRVAGFYDRLEHHITGTFITRDQIDRENPRFLTQLLQRVPGVDVMRGRTGIPRAVRLRGRDCAPFVWLDGAPMPAGEVDMDSFPPNTLEGIEIYLGATDAPGRYQWMRGKSNCGTILLWSRSMETQVARHRPGDDARDLEQLLAGEHVFTAAQVDQPVGADSSAPLDVPYPPTLHATGTSGKVVAEFVVDTLGKVEPETIGIVSSANPLFSDAVVLALQHATFRPAVRHGQRVRQLVHQPIEFVADQGKGKR